MFNISQKITAVAIALALFAGCNTSWVAQAEQIAATMLPIVANTLTLVLALQGKTVTLQDAAMVQTVSKQVTSDLKTVDQLLSDYEAASSTQAKNDAISNVNSALSAILQDESGLLTAMHIEDAATRDKVTAIINLTITEVQSLQALLPAITGKTSAPKGVKLLSAKQLKKAFDHELHKQTGNALVDRAASEIK